MAIHAHSTLRRTCLTLATITATLAVLVGANSSAVPAESGTATPQVAEIAPEHRNDTMLVIGDSYSSYYGDRSTRYPGWWAVLAADLGLDPVLHAEPGTGFLARNSLCTGTRYADRLATVRRHDPRLLFIEGGRNDWRRCTPDGRVVESTRTEIVAALEDYFSRLGRTWDRLGRDRADVYVLSPWGRSRGDKARVIRPLIRRTALEHGFSWVPTRRLTWELAPDGIHPQNDGSRFLRDEVLRNSDLAYRFGHP